ncbi:MAG TPA: YfhO family protein, partial [Thermoanaerobaculia bacterium]|nr:YfhO family protein [Thermoanaerobaculia bacterium]
MSAALLYFAVAAGVSWLCHRLVRPMGIRTAAILILFPLVLTGRALLTGSVYAPIDLPYQVPPLEAMAGEYGIERMHNGTLSDLYAQIIPWRKVVREAWLGGEIPLWNPYVFAGDILAAAGQPAPYDPFLILSFLAPLPQSLTFLASITLFLLGLWMYEWLREIGCRPRGAIFGAAVWMFSSFSVFWLGWPVAQTVSWLPLVMLGVRRVMAAERTGGVPILISAFTLMLLSGHPETAMHVVAIAGLLMLFEAFSRRAIGWRALVIRSGRLLVSGIVALLLAAIHLFPLIKAIPQTMEHLTRTTMYVHQDRSAPVNEAAA